MVLAWCQNKRSCYFFVANQLHTAQRVDSHARGVAFCWADQHMYLYDSTSWCAHSASRGVKAPAALKLPCSKRADIPLARAWGVLQDGEALTAGTYGCRDLDEAREWLYSTHRLVPRVSLDHKGKLTKLRVACGDGCAVILPEDDHDRATEVEIFLERHGIGYKGQSLSAAAHEVFCALIRASRTRLSPAARRALVARQRGCCAMCDSPLDAAEADHLCELANQTHSSATQWQMLCPSCHRTKTDSSQQRPENPIASWFSPYTHEAFVRSPKPAQAVLCPNALDTRQGIVHVDARRCRRNCLVESTEPWPVFCCHDEIMEADGTLGDFNYIDIGVPKGRGRQLALLPYDGPRWYSRQATQFLLRHSLQVTWDDIK